MRRKESYRNVRKEHVPLMTMGKARQVARTAGAFMEAAIETALCEHSLAWMTESTVWNGAKGGKPGGGDLTPPWGDLPAAWT